MEFVLVMTIIGLVVSLIRLNNKIENSLLEIKRLSIRVHDLELGEKPKELYEINQPKVYKRLDAGKSLANNPDDEIEIKTPGPTKTVEAKIGFINDLGGRLKEKEVFSIESIISKLGILLLLIGVGYIYKLAYDNGFIKPWMAIATGYIIGSGVLYFGYRVMAKERLILSQVLFGGGVAVFYIATFAAFNTYHLIGNFLTIVGLASASFMAFFIALYYDQISIGLIGLLGGLLIPFLVGIDYFGIYGMGLYLIFISLGGSLIYFFKKWRILQSADMLGVYFVLFLISLNGSFSQRESMEYALLIMVIYMIFFSIEYIQHMFHPKHSDLGLIYTLLVLSILPILSILFVWQNSDFSDGIWTLIFIVLTAKIFILDYMVFKRKGVSLVGNLLLGFVGLYGLLSLLVYFGGQIRVLLVLLLALIFTGLGRKLTNTITGYIGSVIWGIGFIGALVEIFESINFDQDLLIIDIAVFILIYLVMMVIGYLHKGALKIWIGNFSSLIYLTLTLLLLVDYYIDYQYELEGAAITMMILVIYQVLALKKLKMSYEPVMLAYSLLPLVYVIYVGFQAVLDLKVAWYEAGLVMVYGILMYLMGKLLVERYQLFKFLRLVSYSVLGVVTLVLLSVVLKFFGVGLIVFGLTGYGMSRLENDGLVGRLYTLGLKVGFIGITAIYSIGLYEDAQHMVIRFMVYMIILLMAYIDLRLIFNDSRVWSILHMVLFSAYILGLFADTSGSLSTLILGAYGIGNLFYGALKGERTQTYISLVYILLVAVKFVVIDISSVNNLWKIITSMALGVGLLVLSYVIQPILKRSDYDKEV